ncbi:MAG: flavodoxin [Methanobacterium sp.]|uniref:flavodoxin family protein n=1 Tax=Methanobacterium sp. TaxID=2164 RepID=UPI003D65B606|nr:flavodoxin [Methanobacterium sp.]
MKSTVFYYSRTGKTAIAAKTLAEKIEGDLIEIKDLKNRMGILGWLRSAFDARGDKLTQIEPETLDISNYDTICIGTPVWAGKPAPAVRSAVQNFEITGKDVILFVTLSGSKPEGALASMQKIIEDNGGNVIKTIAIENSGKKSDNEIINEIKEMKI